MLVTTTATDVVIEYDLEYDGLTYYRRATDVNLLADDGPESVERVSGMSRLTGLAVEVRPASGPQDPGSWSGLPEGG